MFVQCSRGTTSQQAITIKRCRFSSYQQTLSGLAAAAAAGGVGDHLDRGGLFSVKSPLGFFFYFVASSKASTFGKLVEKKLTACNDNNNFGALTVQFEAIICKASASIDSIQFDWVKWALFVECCILFIVVVFICYTADITTLMTSLAM